VWQVTEAGAREVITLSARDTRNGVTGVAFSPDGTRVLTGDAGIAAAQVWDVSIDGGAEVADLPAVAGINGDARFTSDGRQLVVSSGAGSVTVWDAQSFMPLRTLDGSSRSLSAPTIGDAPGFYAPLASGDDVFSLAVSPDGRLVAVARADGSVRVWDMVTGRDAFTVDPGPTLAPFMHVAWSPDNELLAIAANDGRTGRATVVDRVGRVVAVWQQEDPFTAIALSSFTPDGDRLVATLIPTAGPDPEAGGVVSWDWRTGDVMPIIDAPAAGIAVLSPTGHLIATTTRQAAKPPAYSGEAVDAWDTATGAARGDPGRARRGRAGPRLQRGRITPCDRQPRWHLADLGPLLWRAAPRPARPLRRGGFGCLQPRRLAAGVGRRGGGSARLGARPGRPCRDRRARGDTHPHRRGVPAVPPPPTLPLAQAPPTSSLTARNTGLANSRHWRQRADTPVCLRLAGGTGP
jgi:WD40 repeat protein